LPSSNRSSWRTPYPAPRFTISTTFGELDLRIGDTVIVVEGGTSFPKSPESSGTPPALRRRSRMPDACPACGSPDLPRRGGDTTTARMRNARAGQGRHRTFRSSRGKWDSRGLGEAAVERSSPWARPQLRRPLPARRHRPALVGLERWGKRAREPSRRDRTEQTASLPPGALCARHSPCRGRSGRACSSTVTVRWTRSAKRLLRNCRRFPPWVPALPRACSISSRTGITGKSLRVCTKRASRLRPPNRHREDSRENALSLRGLFPRFRAEEAKKLIEARRRSRGIGDQRESALLRGGRRRRLETRQAKKLKIPILSETQLRAMIR